VTLVRITFLVCVKIQNTQIVKTSNDTTIILEHCTSVLVFILLDVHLFVLRPTYMSLEKYF
jgi:hypothetical protein